MSKAVLLPEEIEFCEQAGELYNNFLRLERMHPQEVEDIVFHIHAIQTIVMARAAQRAFPGTFTRS